MTVYQVDAFADKVFSGNPAAIIPLNEWLDDDLMQKIAMENNLSETAYFVKTQEGYHLRWFTPDYEIDLCGHATLASAFVIKKHIEPSIEIIHFTTQKAGVLKVICEGEMFTLDFPSRPPQPCEIANQLFASLGIDNAVEVLKARDYFVVLKNEEEVKKLQPDFMLMKQLDTIGVIATAKGDSAEVVSRCFYPGAGIPEDPVTGSAHCNIIPYWAGKLGKNEFRAKQLSQRGGDLLCALRGERVLMSGTAVEFMKGEIKI
ncbi:MAG TPA: PhzF family phenazine biosynthesis protein [Chitinophagaceae bacterium]|nr:PhzF family phenazine biosynthesis protein [Chitinophagaceae bacterium]